MEGGAARSSTSRAAESPRADQRDGSFAGGHPDLVWGAGATLLYTALTLTWSARVWADPSRVIYGHGGDEQLTMSFFALVQHSLATLHNPFFTTYLNAPHGVNLAWETTSPLLAIIAWPFDAAFGPLVGFNILCAAAFVLSGVAAFLAITRLVGNRPAALVGGLLYAFSPFLDVHGSLGQLELSFLVTPPLVALALHAILCGDRDRWVRHGLLLAAVLVAQFYISIEVVFIEVLVSIVVVALAAVLNRPAVGTRLGTATRSILLAGVVSLVCTAFPLYVMFTYPYRPVGTIQPAFAFPTDALNLVVPTFLQLVGLPASSPVTAVFDGGDLAEATGYVGIPMILIALLALLRLRRDRLAIITAVAAVVAVVASLGGHLHVGGHRLLPMPWAPFARLPIFSDVLPARFSLIVDFAVAVLAAALVADVLRRGRRPARVAVGALVALALVAFAPAPLDTSVPPQPRFFTSDAARIPSGSTVLVAPLPFTSSWDAELWQADAGMRFRIVGGYIHGSEADRPATIPTLAAAMQAIEQGKPAALAPGDVAAMRRELGASGVHLAVLGPSPFGALSDLLTAVCGGPGVEDQGVRVWWSC